MTPTILFPILTLLLAADTSADEPQQDPNPMTGNGASALAPASPPEPQAVPSSAGERGLPLPAPLATGEKPAADDEGDETEIEHEIEAQSAEMEQMRQAEEKATLLEPLRPDDSAVRSTARLGLESPLRLRLHDAFGREIIAPPEENRGRIALLPQLDHDLARLQAEYDIPIEVNDAVLAYIRFFQTEPARHHFVKWLGRAQKYTERFRQILRESGLPEDTVFLAMIESGFANLAYSRARASGPWQFIAGTAKRMGLKQDFWVDERRDPEKSARAAARYLKELYDETRDWRLAWAGYNAGVGKIRRAQAKGQTDFWSMTRGRVLRKETKGYVPKLMAAAIISKHQEAFGFRSDEVEPEKWMDYEAVTIPEAADLAAVARACQVSERELLELNPELRRSCTPPHPYQLKVPSGRAEVFARNWPSIETSARLQFASHRVQRGDSLGAVASAYGVAPATVVKMNGLKPGRRLKPGTELIIPVTALARRKGTAPAGAAEARARIEDLKRQNPALVEKEAPPKRIVARVEAVAGRTRATVLVQAGDTLWAIAQKFGVGVTELCRWNGIRNPRRQKLQIGREIVVFPPPGSDARAGRTG
jgi:membrane-bound lytic murein transglycosylase D